MYTYAYGDMYTGFVAVGGSPSHVQQHSWKAGVQSCWEAGEAEALLCSCGALWNLGQSRGAEPEDTRKFSQSQIWAPVWPGKSGIFPRAELFQVVSNLWNGLAMPPWLDWGTWAPRE